MREVMKEQHAIGDASSSGGEMKGRANAMMKTVTRNKKCVSHLPASGKTGCAS